MKAKLNKNSVVLPFPYKGSQRVGKNALTQNVQDILNICPKGSTPYSNEDELRAFYQAKAKVKAGRGYTLKDGVLSREVSAPSEIKETKKRSTKK